VYGPLEGRIDELRPVSPVSDYARAHLETENRFRAALDAPGMRVLVARPCAVYGMPPSLQRFARWSLIPFDFPRQATTGRIVLKSAGLQRRNFVAAEGIANLVGWWLGHEPPPLLIANAPGRDEMSVYDFAVLCAKIAVAHTGRPCDVVRPDPRGAPPVPLEYRTRVGGHLPGPSLEDHVTRIVAALCEKESK
jgi:UDP-glucose 4-epimerase